jgi:AraC-like DNA-binding protein
MRAIELDRSLPAVSPGASGLFRTALAGRGRTLADAFDTLERVRAIPQVSRHASRSLFGARIPLDAREGEGYWDFTRIGSSVYVIVENFTYNSTRVEFVPGDDLLQFYFMLSGDLTIETGHLNPLRVNRPSLLLWRQPRGVDVEEWTAAGSKERCVAISVNRRYLMDELFSSSTDSPLKAFINDESPDLKYCQVPLTAQMFDVAARLVDNPYTGSMGLIFAEAITLELLCLTISSLQTLKLGTPQCDGFSERQLRSLHAARSLLIKQLCPPPSIRQVARVAGINETSLKRGFKALFGETVFNFSVRYRMEHAMKLLADRDMPVSRIAEAVGYSHQTSFATAFRRHFGVCPKKLRAPSEH